MGSSAEIWNRATMVQNLPMLFPSVRLGAGKCFQHCRRRYFCSTEYTFLQGLSISSRKAFGHAVRSAFGPEVDPLSQHDRTHRTISRGIPFHRSSRIPFQWNVPDRSQCRPPPSCGGTVERWSIEFLPQEGAATVTPENGPTSVLSDARMNLSRALPIAPHSPTGKPGGLSPCQVKNEKFSILLQMPKRLGIWSKRTQCPFSNLQLLQLWSKRK